MAGGETKQVLVRLGVHSRVVRFCSMEDLVPSIRTSFAGVSELASTSAQLVIQLKDEEWGGEFVDLREDQEVPNRSVLKVAIIAQVSVVTGRAKDLQPIV